MRDPAAYIVEPELMERLRDVSRRLMAGTDRARDEGDRLRLLLDSAVAIDRATLARAAGVA